MAVDELQQQVEPRLRLEMSVELVVSLFRGFKAPKYSRDSFHEP